MENSTIAAIATPAGSGGIGIVKISGKDALDIAGRIFRRSDSRSSCFQSHRLYHGHIMDPDTGRLIDEVLLGVMRAPKTYTREDIVEINAHSGIVVLRAILELVLKQGAVLAEPGEFTKRAFMNGRIDLTQAEAVIDIITAKTEKSLQSAAAQLKGEMKTRVAGIRDSLLRLMAQIEAAIDFPDDVGDGIQIKNTVDTLQHQVIEPLGLMIEQYTDAHIYRDGIRMIIIGRPNVGKSSLMNRLIEADRVIVTAVPGTTRDVIEETVNIQGIPVTIADSAGLHDTMDPVEVIGMEKTESHMSACDLVLMMIDADSGVTAADHDIYEKAKHKRPMVVINKIDLVDDTDQPDIPADWDIASSVRISALYNRGIDRLKKTIAETVMGADTMTREFSIIPGLRHKVELERALGAAKTALKNLNAGALFELISIDLNEAIEATGEILGVTVKPDLLDEIFSRFCIGK